MNARSQKGPRVALRFIGMGATVAVGVFAVFCILEFLHYKQSEKALMRGLRDRLGMLANLAASVVDGDLHSTLLAPSTSGSKDYANALEPLIRFHNAAPSCYYVYTMFTRDGEEYYVLDTAAAADRLKVPWKLTATTPLEKRTPYDAAEDARMRVAIAAGNTYVYTKTYLDPIYGEFLTGVAPIRNSLGEIVAMAAVDFSPDYIDSLIEEVRRSAWITLSWCALIALISGTSFGTYRATRGQIKSERKKSKELLEKRALEFRAAVETSNDGFCVIDFDGVFLDVNESYCQMVERPRQNIVGHGIGEVHPEGLPGLIHQNLSAIREKGRLAVEIRKFRSDGLTHYLHLTAVRSPGLEDRAYVFLHDVTGIKTAELAIRESERNYRNLLDTIPHGVFHKDLNGRLVTVNAALAKVFQKPMEELIGKTDYDLFPKAFADKYTSDDRHVIESGKTELFEETIWQDGGESFVNTVKTPVEDQAGKVTGVLGIFWDVTEIHKKTEQLLSLNSELAAQALQTQKALGEARTANSYQTRFLANISHEVRSPINRIRGLTSILQLGSDVDEVQRGRYYDIIVQSCDALVLVMEHLLSLSQIEAGKAQPIPAEFDPVIMIEKLAARFVNQAEVKGLAFRIVIAREVPRRIHTDRIMLETILNNLVDNAIKFTNEGSVGVSVGWDGEESGRSRLVFSVSDTGRGIPLEERDNIFRPFYQIEDFATRTSGGSGLGLAIAADFARLLGGALTLESETGYGSTFRFSCVFNVPSENAEHESLGPNQV